MKSRQAVAACLIMGWLFLPNATYNLPGLPPYTKIAAISLPIILATFIYEYQRISNIRFSKTDLPIMVWIFCAFASSLSNNLGIYDGISGLLKQTITWGFPYLIGKIYFSDKEVLRELAKWIVIGGLIYIPFCLWEMRMAPNLNFSIYGFRFDQFATTIRFDGYRPVVFMQHGIALGFWMMSALFMAIHLWRSRAVIFLMGISMGMIVFALFVVFFLCRSLNAIILLIIGLIVSYTIRSLGVRSFVLVLAFLPVFYVFSRNMGLVTSQTITNQLSVISPERATSVHGRLYHEEMLQEKAWKKPLLGWGGWGRSRIYDDDGNDISVTDGLWIIVFGTNGLVGLVSLGLVFLLPTFLFWKRYNLLNWNIDSIAPMVGFSVLLPLYTIDCLMNAMLNPLYIVVAGGMLAVLGSKD
jgi:hypothetical protein